MMVQGGSGMYLRIGTCELCKTPDPNLPKCLALGFKYLDLTHENDAGRTKCQLNCESAGLHVCVLTSASTSLSITDGQPCQS